MNSPADHYLLFAQPGCSSCLRTKEFLEKKKINFTLVDVQNHPGGREKLLEYGMRSVPIVAKDGKYVFGQRLDDVAKFVGLNDTHEALAPEQLIEKWINVLRAAQRYMRQVPDAQMHERAIHNRDRSIRMTGHHVFRIGEAFLETTVGGEAFGPGRTNDRPADGAMNKGSEVADYGETVINRLQAWWGGLKDKSCRWNVDTYFGNQPLMVLYERCAWHSAQHTRQLIAVLERLGIEPDVRLTPADLAGLPVPERIWE